MKHKNILQSFSRYAGIASLAVVSASAEPDGEGWTNLFNGKDLSGWHANTGSGGDGKSQKAGEIFTVRNGVIHVYNGAEEGSKQKNANLYHESVWSKFRLQVEYRWLDKKFDPRNNDKRDAGILFHIHGKPETVWPSSIEMQMGDGKPGDKYVTGDLFVLGNSRAESPSNGIKYAAHAPLSPRGSGKPARTEVIAHAEKPHGEWNLAEVVVEGSEKAEFYLNGVLLNTVFNMKFKDANGEMQPLEKGHISVQGEWAELEYRAIRVKTLE